MKSAIKELVLHQVKTKLHELEALQSELNQSLTKETKSTSGDKHETARAMVHLEMEKLQNQLQIWQKMRAMMEQLTTEKLAKAVIGSLVRTNIGTYYISVGLGKVELENQTIFCLAPTAPIVQKMLAKEVDHQFEFNGKQIRIESID